MIVCAFLRFIQIEHNRKKLLPLVIGIWSLSVTCLVRSPATIMDLNDILGSCAIVLLVLFRVFGCDLLYRFSSLTNLRRRFQVFLIGLSLNVQIKIR